MSDREEGESMRWKLTYAALWLALVPGTRIGIELYRIGQRVGEVFSRGR